MVRRIRDIYELQESGFGQPWPRHGLKLLYWFADKCISDAWNDDMILLCDPTQGDFGFHIFANRYIRRKVKLLPDVNFLYYVVGNLNSPEARMLPEYVREDNTRRIEDNSNADRIIVCYQDENKFGKVYVTTHKNQWNYDPNATYHITRTLIWLIKRYESVYDFLSDTGYNSLRQTVPNNNPVVWHYNQEQSLWVATLDQQVSPLPSQYYNSEIHIDMEPPSTSYYTDVPVNVENDAETQSTSETAPRKKRFWERFCCIL